MNKLGWLIVVGAIIVLGIVLIRYARRIDRLHRRVVQARATLDHALSERHRTVRSLVNNPSFDSDARITLEQVLDVASRQATEANESALTRALLKAQGAITHLDTEGEHASSAVREVGMQLAAARRFHNQEVEQVRRIRARKLVRFFHLAGRAQLPDTYDMDDRY
ncbi:MAG: hypothetical protein Q4P05_03565 [Actinomycetaceae bacterium]|nr:hypothetical protein [Actinomycetaceae bacterium]